MTAERLSKVEGVSRDRWASLARLLRPKAPAPPRPATPHVVNSRRIEEYGNAALDSAAEKIASTPPGDRDNTLNAEAFAIGG